MKEGFESVSFHITNFQLPVSVYQFHEFIKEYRARHAKCKKSRIYAFDISTVVVRSVASRKRANVLLWFRENEPIYIRLPFRFTRCKNLHNPMINQLYQIPSRDLTFLNFFSST